MSARDDYPITAHRNERMSDRYWQMCDEIDRLAAQIERDRPVIDAAEAWTQEWLIGSHNVFDLADDLREAVRTRQATLDALDTASAPDEVNERTTRGCA